MDAVVPYRNPESNEPEPMSTTYGEFMYAVEALTMVP
jgi:hypothetical protein